MEAETVCGRGAGADHDGDYVSALAGETEDWGLVFEYGDVGAVGVVFRHGDFPADTFCRDGFYGAAGLVAVSEFVRGCGVL